MSTLVDKKGRVVIPKGIRSALGLKPGDRLKVIVRDNLIIMEKVDSIAERYAGAFKSKKSIPEDLDEFLNKVLQEWWREST